MQIIKFMTDTSKYILFKLTETAQNVVPKGGQVWLYGSRARGTEREDSDWDLLILIDKDEIDSRDEDNISYPFVEMGWKSSASVNPLLYSYKQWQERSFTDFYMNVDNDKVRIL